MDRYVCIHGHFYQPPRENPWIEEVEPQDSAHPYHDWNERITAECYAPNSAARILNDGGDITDIVNIYSLISFNFGPTLLSWMQRHRPEVHAAIIEADRLSRQRFSGHGAALAQVFNHMIMPLAGERDKRTQVIWGLRDFEHRFGRRAEGMWLPETAVDVATLETLAENGVLFTVLAPHQALRVRPKGESKWQDVTGGRIDPTAAYRCRLPSGRSINLFFYDGPVSRDVAFGGLLASGEAFAERLLGAFSEQRGRPQLVHIATDGETYGHHHPMGDMALAFCLRRVVASGLARLTIYGEFLAKHPPEAEVEIVENSSWSCIHGIERWRGDCGCNSGGRPGWTQKWRQPLRVAMNQLRDWIAPFYEHEAGQYLKDPWKARDDYIAVVLDRSRANVEKFLAAHAGTELTHDNKIRVLQLLEMQRHSMLAFTSCGWFFDEISGLEGTQVMRYAARSMQLAEQIWGVQLEKFYKETLQQAPSNLEAYRTGAAVYQALVKPSAVDPPRIGAHLAAAQVFPPGPENTHIFCYSMEKEAFKGIQTGSCKVGIGRARITSQLTWEEATLSFALLHRGDHEVLIGVCDMMHEEAFAVMAADIENACRAMSASAIEELMHAHFGEPLYSLAHLFKDQQTRVLNAVLAEEMKQITAAFRQILERNYKVMNFLTRLKMPIPKPLRVAVEFTLNANLQEMLAEREVDSELLNQVVDELRRWSIELDRTTLAAAAGRKINQLMRQVEGKSAEAAILQTLVSIFALLQPLHLDIDLWAVQNRYFELARKIFPDKQSPVATEQPLNKEWLEAFRKVGAYLKVHTP